MKILHTISGLNATSGGPTACTYSLLKGLNARGLHADVLAYAPKENDGRLIGDDFFIKAIKSSRERRLAYSKRYLHFLEKNNHYQIYHINALWQYPSHAAAKHARSQNIPYVLSPHGMLYPNALKYSKWLKKFFMAVWFRKDLEFATCLHATCNQEMVHLRNLGLKNPIAVIPNPIDITENIIKPKASNPKSVAFIGRLSPIKCVDSLIKAWNNLGSISKDWHLHIIGDGIQKEELKNLCKSLKIDNVEFLGFLKDKAKEEAYSHITYMVLPSESENFGMVVPETLLQEIPVIASTGTPWKDLEDYNCGWWVNNDVETLTNTLKQALSLPDDEREEMGKNGRQLVVNKYSTTVVTDKMEKLYSWIINGGEKPEFVYLAE